MALLVAGRTVGMCSCNFGSHVLHSTAIHKWQRYETCSLQDAAAQQS